MMVYVVVNNIHHIVKTWNYAMVILGLHVYIYIYILMLITIMISVNEKCIHILQIGYNNKA